MSATIREHMRGWAERLLNGEIKRDPFEDSADDTWEDLRRFADQYVSLLERLEQVEASEARLREIIRFLHPDDAPDLITLRLIRDALGEETSRLFCSVIADAVGVASEGGSKSRSDRVT